MYRRKKRTRVAPKARSKEEKCAAKFCRNKRAVNNTGRMLRLCWKHRSKQLKERHPETYVLNAIRQQAKKRKIPFTITLAQFRAWCAETGYITSRGTTPDAATIDRKNHDEGYHIWNIQILSHAENSEQRHFVPGQEERDPDSGCDYQDRAPDYDEAVDPNSPF